jgi:hypothetical protein
MALFPQDPAASEVHPPEIIDPSLSFETDYGYRIARPRTSRPRRRFTLDYLGLTTAQRRTILNFVQYYRLQSADFQWFSSVIELATFQPTTPVNVLLVHGMVTGQWVGVSNTPNGNINGGIYQITVTTVSSFTLNGSTGAGAQGTGNVAVYLPHASLVAAQDTLASPTTIIGPDRVNYPGEYYRGYHSMQLQIEERF